jgi:hypothetical protein
MKLTGTLNDSGGFPLVTHTLPTIAGALNEATRNDPSLWRMECETKNGFIIRIHLTFVAAPTRLSSF